MIGRHPSHFRPQILIILLVALGLLFAGVRLPDSSRPHRPKPSQRVVLENHHKSCSSVCKHCGDVVAVLAKPALCSASVSFRSHNPVLFSHPPRPLVFSNSGRSPPALLS